jgi:hypothetical protein
MSTIQKILLFFLLPAIAAILYPPQTFQSGILGIALVVVVFFLLGFMLLRGSTRALTLSIFIQGLNAIVRIMMFFPNATTPSGATDLAYILTSILSISLSIYLLLRLDETDIKIQMVY